MRRSNSVGSAAHPATGRHQGVRRPAAGWGRFWHRMSAGGRRLDPLDQRVDQRLAHGEQRSGGPGLVDSETPRSPCPARRPGRRASAAGTSD